MTTVASQIVIDAPLELVWEMTNDVESWPELFTEYEKAEILERSGPTIRFRLTLRPDENGKSWDWVSERTPDPSTHTVRAHRIETGPFEHMNLFWEYRKVDGGVLMRWTQEFKVREGLPFDDAAMAERLNTNTRREMAVIKAKVERAAGRGVVSDGRPVRVLLTLDVQPGRQEDFESLWREHAAAVSDLDASLGQSLHRRVDSETGYVIVTDWADEAAFRAFERSDRQQEYLNKLWPLRAKGSMAVLRSVHQLTKSSPEAA